MRRSKSDPSKYAKNYRSISQRRMTQSKDDEDDDLATTRDEMKRLQLIVDTSTRNIQQSVAAKQQQQKERSKKENQKKKRQRKSKEEEELDNDENNMQLQEKEDEPISFYEQKDNEYESLIYLAPRKKTKKCTSNVILSDQEIKQAQKNRQQADRKLRQLKARLDQKQRRAQIYAKLKQNSALEPQLLTKSANQGARTTKRQTLQRLLQKERAGLTLTLDEFELLYPSEQQSLTKEDDDDDEAIDIANKEPQQKKQEKPKNKKRKRKNNKNMDGKPEKHHKQTSNATDHAKQDDTGILNKAMNQSNDNTDTSEHNLKKGEDENSSHDFNEREKNNEYDGDDDRKAEEDVGNNDKEVPTKDMTDNVPSEGTGIPKNHKAETTNSKTDNNKSSNTNFAAMMLSGLTALKTQVQEKEAKEKAKQNQKAVPSSELERIAWEEDARQKQQGILPSKSTKSSQQEQQATNVSDIMKNFSSSSTKPSCNQQQQARRHASKCLPILNRPSEIETSRIELPVTTMEFEIMDAIRTHDVTIICSETGSGKSTQVPQFLYEYGYTLPNASSRVADDSSPFLIGVTQPRRVAAISTAKRISHEMGHGNGYRIGTDNLVAYQTRYETAGLGPKTHIKFMTDGILLQEIQSDLLLRKYSVIVLDEAHERNLNTDTLLGLLSVAIPMRQRAARESNGRLPPLKLVIMSATLRVEDFDNERLFANDAKPAVVCVPGRTHPVTIHHSKMTELDDYEGVALQKILRIHRKLPRGGILVFLTGKQEIVRMMKRLKQVLHHKHRGTSAAVADVELSQVEEGQEDGGLRDLDDDEADGEFFTEQDDNEDEEEEDKGDCAKNDNRDNIHDEPGNWGEADGIPKKALILPLYSMLSAEEQAKVFAPLDDDDTRLIVIATNLAETSVTIPGISYVVDTGRQKCRNYHAGTGVASYDIMWISKAAADQRAGRAGRTGPGHCYRLYSSSMYARHMPDFALPEVLTRPLEDIVLAMKAMNIGNVAKFPFPTAPDQSQIDGAVKLLADLGCIDVSRAEIDGGDGKITQLGKAVAKLPLGVRYGKMLLIASRTHVLDYAIAIVAVLSEQSPFHNNNNNKEPNETENEEGNDSKGEKNTVQDKKEAKSKWFHKSGDMMAAMLAVGAYSYASRCGKGVSKKEAGRQFCQENDLNPVVMERIQKMRMHLAKLSKTRFAGTGSIASKSGGILHSMKPPTKQQEKLLCQVIVSGLLDNVAMLAPPGSFAGGNNQVGFRSAYLSCSSEINEPLFIDRRSVVYSRDFRALPQWVCHDSIVRTKRKDGTTVATMKNITPLDPMWLGTIAKGSQLLSLGSAVSVPPPRYDQENDVVLCSILTKYGSRGWEITPVQAPMFESLQTKYGNKSKEFMVDDSFRWFARFLMEGKVFPELTELSCCWNDEPSMITRKMPMKKVALLASALSSAGIDCAEALIEHWSQVDKKFLFREMKSWTKTEESKKVIQVWMNMVKKRVNRRKSKSKSR